MLTSVTITNINCYVLGIGANGGYDGLTILQNTGKPSNVVGKIGDLYMNTTANTLYGRKEGACGSLFFGGVTGTGSYLSIPADNDFVLGTDDFTIEWFQYLKNQLPYGRVFSINSRNIGVSIENDNSDGTQTLIVWVNGGARSIYNFNFLDKWVHVALVRSGGVLSVYINGNFIYGWGGFNYDITNSGHDLLIGNEEADSDTGGFKGFITNFRWVKGNKVYSGDFVVPTEPLTSVTGTKLLLNATNYADYIVDSSGLNKTVVNNNAIISWDPLTPFLGTGQWSTQFLPLQLNDPVPRIIALIGGNVLLWNFDTNGYSSVIIYISCLNDLIQPPSQIAQILANCGTEGAKINQLGALPSGVTVFVSGNGVYIYTSSYAYTYTSVRVVPIV
jgi:hypothetical protein